MTFRITHVVTTASTNDDARGRQYSEGDVVWADFQTAGRGQRGHRWDSGKAENLAFSVVLEPDFLPSSDQFLISQMISLAIVDTLASYGIEALIKWTNDIYVGNRKIVGILIEHTSVGATVHRTVLGVGLNVNASSFDPSLPNPVSMYQLLGRPMDREEVLGRLLGRLEYWYGSLRNGEWDKMRMRYHTLLYDRDVARQFLLPDGRGFVGVIRGVKPTGELAVEDEEGVVSHYLFNEIEFVLRK